MPAPSASAAPAFAAGPRLHVAFPDVRSFPIPETAGGIALDRSFFETRLRMPNPTASAGAHARLERRGMKTWLLDAGGKSGTWVNGVRLDAAEARELSEQTIIRIGSVLFVYREGPALLDIPMKRSLGELTAAGLRQSYVGPFSLPGLARQIDALLQSPSRPRLVAVVGARESATTDVAAWVAESLRPGRPFALCSADSAANLPLVLPEGGTLFVEDFQGLPLETQRSLLKIAGTGAVRPAGSEAQADHTVDVTVLLGVTDLDAPSLVPELLAGGRPPAVRVLPLAERPEDVGSMVIQLLSLRGGSVEIETAAIEALMLLSRAGGVGGLRALVDACAGKTSKLTTSAVAAVVDAVVQATKR